MSSPPLRPPRSQVVALLGATLATSMSNLAQTTVLGLLVYKLTGSELDLGFLGLAEFAPAALLVLVAGAAADRFDRRRVTAFGAVSDAIVALALAWYVHRPDGLSTTPIFLLVLAFGAGQAFLSPALRSIPSPWSPTKACRGWWLADPSQRRPRRSSGRYWGACSTGRGLGAARGRGRTFGHRGDGGHGHPVAGPGRGAVGARPLNPVGDDQVDHVLEDGIPASRGGLHEALEGLRFVRAQSIVLGAISLDLFAVLFGGAVTLLPAIAVRLHAGAVGLGWLRAAAGLGAGAMTLVIAFHPVQRRVGRVLLGVVAVFGVWTIVLGVTRSYVLAFVAMFGLSAADAVSVFIRSTLVPLATPPEMRGRVLAVENVFIGASNQFGGFESGVVGQLLGTTASVVLGGIGTLVVALAWGALFAPLRRRRPVPGPATSAGRRRGGRTDIVPSSADATRLSPAAQARSVPQDGPGRSPTLEGERYRYAEADLLWEPARHVGAQLVVHAPGPVPGLAITVATVESPVLAILEAEGVVHPKEGGQAGGVLRRLAFVDARHDEAERQALPVRGDGPASQDVRARPAVQEMPVGVLGKVLELTATHKLVPEKEDAS